MCFPTIRIVLVALQTKFNVPRHSQLAAVSVQWRATVSMAAGEHWHCITL